MILFASPDFAAGASAATFLLPVYAIVVGYAVTRAWAGLALLVSGDPGTKGRAGRLLVVALAAASAAWFGPAVVFRGVTGSFPVSADQCRATSRCKTIEEVEAILGPPHDTSGDARWYYFADSFGLMLFHVDFDAQGRVYATGMR